MSNEFMVGVFGLYAIIIIGVALFAFFEMKKREEKIKKLQTDLKSKIENSFKLTTQDIVILGQAYGLSPANSRSALYRVYKNIENKESFESLKKLVAEIQKEEPFDTMPDEVKPSLSRILELSSQSNSDTDKHILTPITNILTKYQELLEDKKKNQKQTRIAYTLTIVSFFVGAVSLYFAIASPSAKDIAEELIKHQMKEPHSGTVNKN